MAEDPKDKKDEGFAAPDPSERTTVVDLKRRDLPKSSGRLVPVIQIAAGAEQGRVLLIEKNQRITMGRSKECTLPIHDPSCSRNHAELFCTSDGNVFVKDLGSTNGTKVNGKDVKEPTMLKDGDRVQLGDNTILRFGVVPEDDAKMQDEVFTRATRDALTGAYNRRHFNESLERELAYQKRAGTAGLGLVMFDVDHFKKVNDSFGHLAGDEVLKAIGARVSTLVRSEDVFARLGGEEFAVLTRNESIEGITTLSERLRQAMAATPAEFEGRKIAFTVSVGATLVTGKSSLSGDNVVQLADEALYEAKHGGRNRCVMKLPKT